MTTKHALLLVGLFNGACLVLAACDNRQPNRVNEIATVHVKLDEEKRDLLDRYVEADAQASIGVDEGIATKALSGDGHVATLIGNEFAHANRATQARYWYQIAAENGDAIGMQNLSIALRDVNCVRANFWLARALATDQLGEHSRTSMQRDFEEYRATCVGQNK